MRVTNLPQTTGIKLSDEICKSLALVLVNTSAIPPTIPESSLFARDGVLKINTKAIFLNYTFMKLPPV